MSQKVSDKFYKNSGKVLKKATEKKTQFIMESTW